MPEADHDDAGKRCLLAIDTLAGPRLHELAVPASATVADLLALAQRQALAEGVDWAGAAVGIWGQRAGRGAVAADGDRVEVYLPLRADPKLRRRQRAGGQGTALRRPVR